MKLFKFLILSLPLINGSTLHALQRTSDHHLNRIQAIPIIQFNPISLAQLQTHKDFLKQLSITLHNLASWNIPALIDTSPDLAAKLNTFIHSFAIYSALLIDSQTLLYQASLIPFIDTVSLVSLTTASAEDHSLVNFLDLQRKHSFEYNILLLTSLGTFVHTIAPFWEHYMDQLDYTTSQWPAISRDIYSLVIGNSLQSFNKELAMNEFGLAVITFEYMNAPGSRIARFVRMWTAIVTDTKEWSNRTSYEIIGSSDVNAFLTRIEQTVLEVSNEMRWFDEKFRVFTKEGAYRKDVSMEMVGRMKHWRSLIA